MTGRHERVERIEPEVTPSGWLTVRRSVLYSVWLGTSRVVFAKATRPVPSGRWQDPSFGVPVPGSLTSG